ncbi:MAG: hypothetical protein AAF270_07785, partial [Pseudomonadota bacterium]
TADAHVLSDIAKSYSSVTLAGVALTKIDEAARLGGALTVLIRDALPLAYICDGQRVPDNLEIAAKRKLWLINHAVQASMSDDYLPDETYMADQFGMQEVVNG